MSIIDENNAGGVAEDLELETEVVTTTEDPSGDDPFDSIEDEKVRADAKKFRAIANRHKDKPQETKVETKVLTADTSKFVSKDDMARIATREAKELVGVEVTAEYEELIKIPLGGYDPLDPKSIAANLKERFAILQARKSPVEKKEDVSGLSSTTVVAGTGAGSGKENKPVQKDPPNFHKTLGPEDWYPKKSKE